MCYKRSLENALIPLPTVPMAKSHDFKTKARDRAQLKAKAWRQLPFLPLWAVVHSPCSFQSQCWKIHCQHVPPWGDSQGSWEKRDWQRKEMWGTASSPQLPQPVPVLCRLHWSSGWQGPWAGEDLSPLRNLQWGCRRGGGRSQCLAAHQPCQRVRRSPRHRLARTCCGQGAAGTGPAWVCAQQPPSTWPPKPGADTTKISTTLRAGTRWLWL